MGEASAAEARAVDAPVAHDRHQPVAAIIRTLQDESADCPLPRIAIAVQQVDGERRSPRHRVSQGVVLGVSRVPNRPVPEADDSRRHVQITGLRSEPIGVEWRLLGWVVRPEAPPMDDANAGPGVAERYRQVGVVVVDLSDRAAAWQLDGSTVDKADLLRLVFRPRRDQQRPHPNQKRLFGNRAALFAERTAANVATASTRVPPAVANADVVVQSIGSPFV